MVKRTQRKVPPHTPCGYCFSEWATGWDHLIPWSYRPDDSPINLYPSCKRCNCLLYNTMFATLRDKREYVRTELTRRGEWKLPELWQELPQEEGAPEILRGILSLEGLGSQKPTQEAPSPDAPNPVAPVLVWDASKVRGRRDPEMRPSLPGAETREGGVEADTAGVAPNVHAGPDKGSTKLRKCARKGCVNKFPVGLRGKKFCSDACRASLDGYVKRRLAHKVPEQTAERKALKLAAAWLGERV